MSVMSERQISFLINCDKLEAPPARPWNMASFKSGGTFKQGISFGGTAAGVCWSAVLLLACLGCGAKVSSCKQPLRLCEVVGFLCCLQGFKLAFKIGTYSALTLVYEKEITRVFLPTCHILT